MNGLSLLGMFLGVKKLTVLHIPPLLFQRCLTHGTSVAGFNLIPSFYVLKWVIRVCLLVKQT